MTTIEPIKLFEHQEWPSTDVEKIISRKIELNESDRKIVKFLKNENIVEFDELKNGIRIKSHQFIGTVSFSKFTLKIIPKIYKFQEKSVWRNITQCMQFTKNYSPEKIINFGKISINDDESILQDYLVWTLVYECNTLLRRGLLKSYVTHEENLSYLKGKIILKNQFQNDMRKKVGFYCEYDELEFDNIENRIILQTLIQCRKIAINSELKKEVFKLIEQLSGIIQKVPITVDDIKRVRGTYNRQNDYYEDSHIICEMIIENKGISDFYENKENQSFSVPFFVDMNKVFEKFVTKLFEVYYHDKIFTQKKQNAWIIDDTKQNIKMIPDIILQNKHKEITIIDVKYKDKLSVNDLYQIGFYIHEYTSEKKEQEIKEAYAILPNFLETQNMQKSYQATKSKIKIYAKFISIDDYIQLITKPNSRKNIVNKIQTEILNHDKIKKHYLK